MQVISIKYSKCYSSFLTCGKRREAFVQNYRNSLFCLKCYDNYSHLDVLTLMGCEPGFLYVTHAFHVCKLNLLTRKCIVTWSPAFLQMKITSSISIWPSILRYFLWKNFILNNFHHFVMYGPEYVTICYVCTVGRWKQLYKQWFVIQEAGYWGEQTNLGLCRSSQSVGR